MVDNHSGTLKFVPCELGVRFLSNNEKAILQVDLCEVFERKIFPLF